MKTTTLTAGALLLASALMACADRNPFEVWDTDHLTFRADSRLEVRDGEQAVVGVLVVSNSAPAPVDLTWGGCYATGATLRVYADASRHGPRVFDQQVWLNSPGRSCTLEIEGVRVPARGSTEILTRWPVAEILGEQHSEGSYYFTVEPRISNPSLFGPELKAGSAVLTR